MGSVELGLEEEGIVSFCGVHGDMNGVDFGVLEMFDDFRLFFGIETEVGIDGEDEEFVTGGIAPSKKIFGRIGITLEDGVVAGPHVDDSEISVSVKSLRKLFALMKHVALESVTDLIPREHLVFVNEVTSGAPLKGIEMDESFV